MADDPVAVGIVGAGPWASMVHAPVLAAGPGTRLAGVHARRPEAAAALADRHGAVACASLDELVEASDVVVVAVAPEAQPGYARELAASGMPLALEKPLALGLPAARSLAADVAAVRTIALLTWRFSPTVQAWIEAARGARHASAVWRTGALEAGPFAGSPWRQRHGLLVDVGPHVFDLLHQALGPVDHVAAAEERGSEVRAEIVHAGGARSTVVVDGRAATDEIALDAGGASFDGAALAEPGLFAGLRAAIGALATGPPPPGTPTVDDALRAQEVVAAVVARAGGQRLRTSR